MPKTPGARDISPFTRGRVIGQHDCSRSIRQIAENLRLKRSVVQNIVTGYSNKGKTTADKRPGRPSSVSERMKRAVVHEVRKNPKQALHAIARGVKRSASTVRRILHAKGYQGRIARRKPLLSTINIQRRSHWAQSMKSHPLDFWHSVIFTDESQFEQFSTKRRQWVWRRPEDTYLSEYLQPTVKFGGLRVMVWAGIWYGGKTELVIVHDRLNAAKYIDILKRYLLPLYESGILNNETHTLQEDNAPCHVAKMAMRWKQENGIQRLPWPPQSPDMNPIEHVWDHLERELKKITPPPTNVGDLQHSLLNIWNNLDQSVINNLIDTMPKRVQSLLKAHGGATPY